MVLALVLTDVRKGRIRLPAFFPPVPRICFDVLVQTEILMRGLVFRTNDLSRDKSFLAYAHLDSQFDRELQVHLPE